MQNVFRRSPMHGISSNAEAARDLPLVEHDVSGNPQAQTFAQSLCLLHAGLRHQDHEFVAAIAAHNVRLPRLLLQDSSHPRQNKVAFQMSFAVVDIFELVEVQQHH